MHIIIPIRMLTEKRISDGDTLIEEKVLYRTLKSSISAMYLECLKGSIKNPF